MALSEFDAFRRGIEIRLDQARELPEIDQDRIRVGVRLALQNGTTFARAVPRLAGTRADAIAQSLLDDIRAARRELPDRADELAALIEDGLPNL